MHIMEVKKMKLGNVVILRALCSVSLTQQELHQCDSVLNVETAVSVHVSTLEIRISFRRYKCNFFEQHIPHDRQIESVQHAVLLTSPRMTLPTGSVTVVVVVVVVVVSAVVSVVLVVVTTGSLPSTMA